MHSRLVLRVTRHRLRLASTWVALLGFGLLFSLFPVFFMGWTAFTLETVLAGFTCSAFYGLVSPAPWLWTGDDRIWAGPLRGFAQALALDLLLIGAVSRAEWVRLFDRAFGGQVPFVPIHVMGMMLVGYFITQSVRDESGLLENLRAYQRTRTLLLRAQLNPHFLFNGLNAISEAGDHDWSRAKQGLCELSNVYRYLIDVNDRETSSLGEERSLLESVLAVESLRRGRSLSVEWEWAPELETQPVLSLVMLPLVENALQHGVGRNPDGGRIRLVARSEGGRLHLEVWNTTPPPGGPRRASTGTGLRNLRERLALGYGPGAAFELVETGPWTRACLTLPGNPQAS